MKMHMLSGGRVRYPRGIYYPGAPREEMVELPVSCALLKHKQGLVLFDTGCHPSVVTNAEARWGGLARLMEPIFTEQEAVVGQLPLAAVTAGDIDVVVCSHLHPDHCGCNVFFPRAMVLVQAAEVAAARADNSESRGYLAIEWDLPGPIEQLDGERDLFGDGRVVLIPLPGHTPGSIGGLVELEKSGTFLLASDTVSLRSTLDTGIIPRNTWNAEALAKSLAEVKRIEARGTTVLCGHDEAQWLTLRKGADAYE